jgi:cytochrome P450
VFRLSVFGRYGFLGVLPKLRRDPLGVLAQAALDSEEVIYLGRCQRRVYLLNHPALIKHVLHDNHRNYTKRPGVDRIKVLLGEGLTTSDGSLWQRQRRSMAPTLQPRRISAFLAVITATTEKLLDRWQLAAKRGQPLDISAEMMDLTRAIIMRILFGSNAEAQAAALKESLAVALDHANWRIWALFDYPTWLPIPRNRKLHAARVSLNTFFQQQINERRRNATERDDMTSLLMDLRDEDTGEPMSDSQLCDEIMTILIAGHTTTATALAWIWILLSSYTGVERELHEELSKKAGEYLSIANDLRMLPYTRALIEETMRLYPPTWITARSPIEDDEIDGYYIPARSILLLSPYTIQRHPAFWEKPEEFNPSRFSAERSVGRPRYAYFPFGGGPRVCIGMGLAMMEMHLIIAMIAQSFRLYLLSGQQVRPEPTLTLRPSPGTLVGLEKI